jgi:hypothetical protein
MLSTKFASLVLAVMFIALANGASAQWSPGGAMVYMGDLNLAASSISGGRAVQVLGGSDENSAPMNNSTINNSSLDNSSADAISMDNSTSFSPVTVPTSAGAAESSGKAILDLSSYSRDRTNKNLTGYTNVMYPITGSRGTTTSTSGGGGGGGCGCGG